MFPGPARRYDLRVLTDDRRTVAHAKIDRLARAGLDPVTFWREATEVLRSVVRFDFHPCWFTVDPEHLLITGHFNAGLSETPTPDAKLRLSKPMTIFRTDEPPVPHA